MRVVDAGKRKARAQDTRVAGRGGEELVERPRVEPLPDGDRAGLRDGGHRRAGDEVVAELRRLAGAVTAHEHDQPAERLEERPGALERVLPAADHDRQRRVRRAARPTADRRVEDVQLRALGREPSRERRRARRHVDEERPRPGSRPDAVLAQHHVLDRVRRRQRQQDGVRRRSRLAGGLGGSRAERFDVRRGRGRNRRRRGPRRRGVVPSEGPSSRGRSPRRGSSPLPELAAERAEPRVRPAGRRDDDPDHELVGRAVRRGSEPRTSGGASERCGRPCA